MRRSEWVAFLYFVCLVIAAIRPMPRVRRLALLASSTLAAASVLAIAARAGAAVRDWAPLAYVFVGYYASGLLFVWPSERFEAWLIGWDRRWLGDPTTRFARWPRWFVAYLDVVYMGCFLLLPMGFGALVFQGEQALADRYWTMVLGAELGSFVALAIVQTRPPWRLERQAALPDGGVRRAALRWVRHLTIGVNTFPSGHAAGSLAVALAVVGTLPATGAILLVIAISIALACIVGRYHYVVDVLAGIGLAVGIFLVFLAMRAQ